MCLTYANDFLISSAKDGTLMIHEIKDRDRNAGLISRNFDQGYCDTFAEEILTEKAEMEADVL
jgi:hypothetical protein